MGDSGPPTDQMAPQRRLIVCWQKFPVSRIRGPAFASLIAPAHIPWTLTVLSRGVRGNYEERATHNCRMGCDRPLFKYFDTRQLFINTGTTIITFFDGLLDPEHSEPRDKYCRPEAG
jgi:low affinity Fe/Cu permease